MEALGINSTPFFEWLLKTTIQASVLICLILFVKAVLRQKLPVRWHYYLWLLLLIRLALPWSPQSRISIFNLMSQSASQQKIKAVKIIDEGSEGTVQSDGGVSDNGQSEPASVQTNSVGAVGSESVSETVTSTTDNVPPVVIQPIRSQTSSLSDILPLIWFAGALILAGYIFFRNIILWKAIKSERQVTDQQILELLEDCKMQMRIQTVVGVVVTDKVKSPALFGFVRPRLLLPQGLLEELDLDELQYVFLHELAHLRRRDIYFGWMVSLLQVAHWFNPLIWFAFRRMRTDQELACDALALSTMSVEEPPKYGRTLINLFERFSQVNYVPSIAGILEDKSQLERRIKMITKYNKSSYRWSPLAAILIIILACVSLPDAERTKAFGRSDPKSSPPIVLRRVWAGPDVDCYGAPSPDGRYLSFVDWETSDVNHNDLAIYEIATGKKRRLTDNTSWYESDEYQFALSSIWSPDGKQIAYQWWSNVIELCVIGIDGSKPRVLYGSEEKEWVRPYDWSPDGRQILACVAGKDGKNRIVLVSVTDGSVRVLKTLDKYYGLRNSSWYTPKNMSFSPDGRHIVYDFPQKEDSHDISLMSTDGSREIPLVEHPASDYVLGWAPDGKNVIFASDRTGTLCIWLIAVADGKPQGVPELVKADIGRFIPMGLTEDGSFYYSRSSSTSKNDVYTTRIDPETGKIVVPPHEAIKSYVESNTTPDYSPDGKYLAYISRRPAPLRMLNRTTPLGNVLCIRSLGTGEERELKPEIKNFVFPQWSPDSRSIMVVNFEEDNEHAGLYRIDAQTGNVKLLVMSENNKIHGHLWCADGKSIFLVRSVSTGDRDEHFCQIVVRDIESGVENELYRDSRSDIFSISLSPDGKWLAFLDKAKNRTLRIMPAAGGEPREIHIFDKEDNRYTPHTWTADGKYILMPKFRPPEADGKWDLWRIPVDDGEPQNFGFEMASILQLSAHPDGQHIAFCTTTFRPAEVWVMENFLPETLVAKSVGGMTLHKIMDKSESDQPPRVSPDGKYFCEVRWKGKASALSVRELETGQEKILVSSDDNCVIGWKLVISPDSKLIAYNWIDNERNTSELRVGGLNDSEYRVLCSGKYPIVLEDWSDDGAHILGSRKLKDKDGHEQSTEIVRISVEDGSVEAITTIPKERSIVGYGEMVNLSPDGQYIAYHAREREAGVAKYNIFIFDIDKKHETILEHAGNNKLVGWTPDGKGILFSGADVGTLGLWLQRVNGGQPEGNPQLIRSDIGRFFPIGLTHDGACYYISSFRIDSLSTASLDLRTGEVLSSPKLVCQDTDSYYGCTAWSPDGKYLTYCRRGSGLSSSIHIRSLIGGVEKVIDTDLPWTRWITWTPSGQSLIASWLSPGDGGSTATDFIWSVHKIDIETGNRNILFKSDVGRPIRTQISPDEKSLFYNAGTSLLVRDLSTGEERKIFELGESGWLFWWDLSPDGRSVAVGAPGSGSGPTHLKVISLEGKTLNELLPPNWGKIRDVLWAPDGKSILFTSQGSLWQISVEGGEPRKLLDSAGIGDSSRPTISLHPDGQRIALITNKYSEELWVMENFLPEDTENKR